MPVLVLMFAIGLVLLTQARDVEATIALSAWCGVVGLMLALAWLRRIKGRREAVSSRSLLELDSEQRRPPPDR